MRGMGLGDGGGRNSAQTEKESVDAEVRPLDFSLIRRLFSFSQPYASKRNKVFFVAIMRSLQVPTMSWLLGKIIRGPIAQHDPRGTIEGTLAFIGLALITDITLH